MAPSPDFVRSRSMWLDTLEGDDLTPRPALPGDVDADVAIVGAGFTGLWTAYHLARIDPSMRIVVIEREVAGFGASGRNGGWCSSLLPMSRAAIARRHGRDAAIRMQRTMYATVDEVVQTAAAEGIDCGVAKGGFFSAATSPAHVGRQRAAIADARAWGFGEDDLRHLDRTEAAARIRVEGLLGAVHTPHCAALNPAALVRGLARVVEARGVRIHEGTTVTQIEPRTLTTDHGTVRAETVIRATEGFTASLPGQRRTVVPIYSLMIATEPLPEDVWDGIGWTGRETLNDERHLIIYAQRTADGRIAFGGRGAPYHYGSRIDASFDRDERVHDALHRTLVELFPGIGDARITHRWGGPLGAARDWHCSVGFDRVSGFGWAGAYVGDGVATSNLAGRTLADLVTGRTSDLTTLPWVGHRSRSWEPEPLRWLGINGVLRLPSSADRREFATGRPSRVRSWILDRALGH